jgi:hypothetical protein
MSETMQEIPNPVVECAGCGKELSRLQPHLKVQIKAEVAVLLATPIPPSEEGEITGNAISLGTKSGRGRIMYLHDFDCLSEYAQEREGQKAKLEPHVEDEIYEPEDNRSPEELVEAGELPPEILAYQTALAEASEGEE